MVGGGLLGVGEGGGTALVVVGLGRGKWKDWLLWTLAKWLLLVEERYGLVVVGRVVGIECTADVH